MKLKLSLIIFICILLTACKPMDAYFPNDLQGSLKDGVYTTPVGKRPFQCRFDILVPQIYNFYEVSDMETLEVFGRKFTFVSFGPMASDRTVFRVMVAHKGRMPLSMWRGSSYYLMVDIGSKDRDCQMTKIFDAPVLVNGRFGIYEVYTQTIAGVYQYISRKQLGEITLTHSFTYADYGDFGVTFWVTTSSDSAMYPINYKNRCEILDGSWRPQRRFIRSFGFRPQRQRTLEEVPIGRW